MNLTTRCTGTEHFHLLSRAQISARDAETAAAQGGCRRGHEQREWETGGRAHRRGSRRDRSRGGFACRRTGGCGADVDMAMGKVLRTDCDRSSFQVVFRFVFN